MEIVKKRKMVDNKSYLATYEEIVDNEYNLSVSNYLKFIEEEKFIDINKINEEINSLLIEENTLNIEINKIIDELRASDYE